MGLMLLLLYRDVCSREVLDGYLSRALSIELEEKHLALIDESNYVLTLDYTIKMLNIHERSLSLSLPLPLPFPPLSLCLSLIFIIIFSSYL